MGTSPGTVSPPYEADAQQAKKDDGHDDLRSIRSDENDLLKGEIIDRVLAAKMNLVNDVSDGGFLEDRAQRADCGQAIDEIGFTPYHGKLFVLNGFGYGGICFVGQAVSAG